MRRSGGGRIINFADWVAASGRPRYKGFLAYYVAKAGVKALTEALALELAADGILVNAIAPGPILAPPETTDEEFQAVERATPLGRWGGPEEIAKTVLALIESDFITGETIRVDGGRHLRVKSSGRPGVGGSGETHDGAAVEPTNLRNHRNPGTKKRSHRLERARRAPRVLAQNRTGRSPSPRRRSRRRARSRCGRV